MNDRETFSPREAGLQDRRGIDGPSSDGQGRDALHTSGLRFVPQRVHAQHIQSGSGSQVVLRSRDEDSQELLAQDRSSSQSDAGRGGTHREPRGQDGGLPRRSTRYETVRQLPIDLLSPQERSVWDLSDLRSRSTQRLAGNPEVDWVKKNQPDWEHIGTDSSNYPQY